MKNKEMVIILNFLLVKIFHSSVTFTIKLINKLTTDLHKNFIKKLKRKKFSKLYKLNIAIFQS